MQGFKITTVEVAYRIEERGEKLEVGPVRRLLHSSGMTCFGNERGFVAGMKMKEQIFSHPIILTLPVPCNHYCSRPIVTVSHPKPDYFRD